MPNSPDGQDDDKKIGHDVCHDDALQNQNLVHAMTDAVNCPLLLDWIAEEDEYEGER